MEMVSRLPNEKILKIKRFFETKESYFKRTSVSLGLLNFAPGCVVSGRAFLRRLHDLIIKVSDPNFYFRFNTEARADLADWELFMTGFNGKHVLLSDYWVADILCLYTNAASTKGFAGVFGNQWFMHSWPAEFTSLHINILELFPIFLAVDRSRFTNAYSRSC